MLEGVTGWHLLVLAGVMLLLFGARRLPDAARSLGRSVRILRSEVREFGNDGDVATPPSGTPDPSDAGRGPDRRHVSRGAGVPGRAPGEHGAD